MTLELLGIWLMIAAIVLPGRLTGKGLAHWNSGDRIWRIVVSPSVFGRIRQFILLAGIVCVVAGVCQRLLT